MPGDDHSDEQRELHWDSILYRDDLNEELVAYRDRMADAARRGDWPTLFGLLDDEDRAYPALTGINSVRVGGMSGFAALHQAAWHGADEVVGALLERGAWRSLRTTKGETAEEIARRRGHDRVAAAVAWSAPSFPDTRLADMETYLSALITVRARQLKKDFRMPQLGPLEEHPDAQFWCPIAGMYGGFAYRWLDPEDRSVLEVSSWSRVVGGSGHRHHITENGATLVEDGF